MQIIILQKIYKYNHIQPPDAVLFTVVDLILNQVIYFSMKVTYTFF